jgi:HTH-type transcriptional regulator, competence development regulator
MEVGEYIRNLRKSKELLLRELSSFLSMDQAILSKIERGERKATKEQISAISDYFQIKNDELKILWLSDRVIYELKEEEQLAGKVLRVSEERIKYGKS